VTSPNEPRIDRAALDRIIQRAAELQTGERDIGDNLTPDEVLQLGREVGIPSRYLQQAMLEHQTTTVAAPESTLVGRVVGPAEVRAQRVVQGNPEDVVRALITWMERNELMVVQRQLTGRVSWEPLRGMQAAIRRGTASFDTTKPKFMLSRAELVVATVTPLESGYSHVSLTATLRATRRGYLTGSAVSAVLGLGFTGALLAIGMLNLVAIVPVGATVLVSGAFLRKFRPISERVLLGLERALDFLERGGVKPGHEQVSRGPGLLDTLASEVRRAISAATESRRESHPRRSHGDRPTLPENKP